MGIIYISPKSSIFELRDKGQLTKMKNEMEESTKILSSFIHPDVLPFFSKKLNISSRMLVTKCWLLYEQRKNNNNNLKISYVPQK